MSIKLIRDLKDLRVDRIDGGVVLRRKYWRERLNYFLLGSSISLIMLIPISYINLYLYIGISLITVLIIVYCYLLSDQGEVLLLAKDNTIYIGKDVFHKTVFFWEKRNFDKRKEEFQVIFGIFDDDRGFEEVIQSDSYPIGRNNSWLELADVLSFEYRPLK